MHCLPSLEARISKLVCKEEGKILPILSLVPRGPGSRHSQSVPACPLLRVHTACVHITLFL